ncbi:hypothetical protein SOVF_135660 isoform A [Spinacia oleracea]|nr:hypothetical protein SOVF_135660 isoform A [Spinacia oleracea]
MITILEKLKGNKDLPSPMERNVVQSITAVASSRTNTQWKNILIELRELKRSYMEREITDRGQQKLSGRGVLGSPCIHCKEAQGTHVAFC